MWTVIVERLADIRDRLKPWVVVNEYERGIILRLGKYHKTLEPGLSLKRLFVDVAFTEIVVFDSQRLPTQTITTRDGKELVITPAVSFEIRDIKKYLLQMQDQTNTLADSVQSAIETVINDTDLKDALGADIKQSVLERARKRLNEFGFKIIQISFIDNARMKSIRLLQNVASPVEDD